MNLNSRVSRWLLGAAAAGLIGYGVYRLYSQATTSATDAIVLGILLGAWLLTYLAFRKKLTAWFKNPN